MKQQSKQRINQQSGRRQGTLPLSRFASIFILSAFTIFGICVAILVAVVSGRQFDKIQQIEHQKRINSLGDNVEDFVHHRLDILNDQSKLSSIKQAVMQPDESKADITDFMSTLSIMGSKPQIVLLDFAGAEIHKTQENPNVDFTGYQWISQIIDGKQSNYAGILHLPGGPHWCIAVPVLYGGMPEGILSTLIPLQNMDKSHVFSVLSSQRKEKLKILQKDTVIASFGADITAGLAQKKVLDRFNLTLQYTGQTKQITSARNRLLITIIVLLLLLSLPFFLVMDSVARKWFVKPLQQLRDATHSISKKTGMPRFTGQGSRIQEIALLSNDLKVMAKQVDDRRSKLEELVEVRTGELNAQKTRLINIIEATNVGTWEWNVQTGETFFNEKWANIIGYSLNEISPTSFETWVKFAHPDDLKKSGELLGKHFNGELDYYHFESRMKHKDGSWIWVFDRGKIMSRDDDGKPLWVFGTHTDITERKRDEEELTKTNKSLVEATAKANSMASEAKKANAAKSEFVANMSHEIRTPMNSVLGYSELLQATALNKIQKQYIDAVASSGKSLLGIINSILDFSKIEAGKLNLDVTQSDLIDVIEQSAGLIKHQVSKKGVELLIDIDPELPRFAMIDALRLRQVLVNLLSNALKFTEKGEIELKASLLKMKGKRGQIKFSVRDTGIGISGAQQKKLFKAFSQADTSTTRIYGGTGLGLIIAYQLVRKMGAKLEVESVKGVGSEFYFTIETELIEGEKSEKQAIKAAAEEESINDTTKNRTHKILIADDNPLNMAFITTLLKGMMPKAELIEALNGKEAFEKIITLHPDLVFMDVQMPKMDGNEATSELRRHEAQEKLSRTVVVGLTAGALKIEKDKCFESGMDAFLTKPIEIDKLKEVLNKYLSSV